MKPLGSVFFTSITILTALTLLTPSAATAQSKPKALLNHVAIFVVNLERSKAYYNEMFQLDTIPEPFHDGKHAWYSIAPGVAMHVIQGAEKPKEYFLNNHTCFSVPSVEVFVEKLKTRHMFWYNAKGIKGEITTRIDGVKQIWVNDPDGYWIEVNDARF